MPSGEGPRRRLHGEIASLQGERLRPGERSGVFMDGRNRHSSGRQRVKSVALHEREEAERRLAMKLVV